MEVVLGASQIILLLAGPSPLAAAVARGLVSDSPTVGTHGHVVD